MKVVKADDMTEQQRFRSLLGQLGTFLSNRVHHAGAISKKAEGEELGAHPLALLFFARVALRRLPFRLRLRVRWLAWRLERSARALPTGERPS